MQSIKFSFEKQEHDCYSKRSYSNGGDLIHALFICPVCGPYREWQKGVGWRRLQPTNGINHSGVSIRKWGE